MIQSFEETLSCHLANKKESIGFGKKKGKQPNLLTMLCFWF
jgi:hypothetical protein